MGQKHRSSRHNNVTFERLQGSFGVESQMRRERMLSCWFCPLSSLALTLKELFHEGLSYLLEGLRVGQVCILLAVILLLVQSPSLMHRSRSDVFSAQAGNSTASTGAFLLLFVVQLRLILSDISKRGATSIAWERVSESAHRKGIYSPTSVTFKVLLEPFYVKLYVLVIYNLVFV
jgi:hypothetical protein